METGPQRKNIPPAEEPAPAEPIVMRWRGRTMDEVLKAIGIRKASDVSKRRLDINTGDRVFYGFLKTLGWGMILLLLGIVWMLVDLALPALKEFGWRFFIVNDWNPPMDSYGALPFIYGTVVSSLLALLFSVPVSLGVALFLTELAPRWLSKGVGFLVEMLAAIPSVVYGLWGIFILAPWIQSDVGPFLIQNLGPETFFSQLLANFLTVLGYPVVLVGQLFGFTELGFNSLYEMMSHFANNLFAGPAYGVGMLSAGLILAIMITPTISAISREVFSTVGSNIREAALGLGATRWEMIKLAVLKTTKSGILGAVILGLGRALGETMAVTMVIGNRNDIPISFLAPAQTMASVIANEYPEASGVHVGALAAVGLALFAVSLLINTTARLIIWRVDRGTR